MRDETFDRDYQNGRGALNSGIDEAWALLVGGLWLGFRRLHSLQWQSPWGGQRRSGRRRHPGLA
jgi:hypothetical protein